MEQEGHAATIIPRSVSGGDLRPYQTLELAVAGGSPQNKIVRAVLVGHTVLFDTPHHGQ
jgi:hypothetical protein